MRRVVEPAATVPLAGPPTFLDAALAHHNAETDDGILPDQQRVTDWLATRRRTDTALLLPGVTGDAEHSARVRHPMGSNDPPSPG